MRPLVLGELDGAMVLASETCALDIIGARLVREVEPGETRDHHRARHRDRYRPFAAEKSRFCIFEYVYFARPDSIVEGRSVYEVRKRIGARAGARIAGRRRHRRAGAGFRRRPRRSASPRRAGIPFDLGIIRNHYVGRTFIEPSDAIRHMGVKLKHNANSQGAARQARRARRQFHRPRHDLDEDRPDGARRRRGGGAHAHRHPPTTNPCFYGVDTPEKSKLLASRMSVAEMADFLRVDSLSFISIDGLYRAVGEMRRDPNQPQYCDACFTGEYPTRLTDRDRTGEVRHLNVLAESA